MSKSIAELNVAVLAGGPGSEREVSLASGKGVEGALAGSVGAVTLVDVAGPGFELPAAIDVCFNVVHGTYGEDGGIQAELTKRGIPYTGARELSSRLAFDKVKSKDCFIDAGVSTPKSAVVMVDAVGESPVGLPCVVKPPREGSSVGVHIVHTDDEWRKSIADAGQYSDDILIEELIVGKELTVGVLGEEAFPIVHIQPMSGFYDISNKYPWMTGGDGGSDYFCPADLGEDITARIQAEALRAHQSLGIEVYSRVDVLLRESDQKPFVLEVNTLPGMTETSLLPKAAAAAGKSYTQLCLSIIERSLTI